MKILLVGKNSKNMNKFSPSEIEELVRNSGFEIVGSNPDIVISFGGDGTLLHAEREYPGIPKLPIRDSKFCNKCPNHEDKKVLEDLLNGKLTLKEYRKLHTNLEGKDFYALNDFVIRNQHPIHSIRFKMTANNNPEKFYIGDGIVAATPFGSTAYFKSVTGQSFEEGFGLAFNNTTEKEKPVFLNEEKQVKFSLVRGKANLSFDNNPEIFNIAEGTQITFDLSNQVAKIYTSSLRCPNCKVIRS